MILKNRARLFDPINYKECCYYIALEKMGRSTKDHIEYMSFEKILQWLGTNCGQYFLNAANELIDDYPYKELSSLAIICGEVVNQEIVDKHKEWFEESLGVPESRRIIQTTTTRRMNILTDREKRLLSDAEQEAWNSAKLFAENNCCREEIDPVDFIFTCGEDCIERLQPFLLTAREKLKEE